LNPKYSFWKTSKAPEGERIYAIGDIHGRADLLGQLLQSIERDNNERPAASVRLICLGDYVDRGPASKEVIERLLRPMPLNCSVTFLKGNHEDLLLTFLDDPLWGFSWLENGGDATLVSYGVPAEMAQAALWRGEKALREAATLFASLVPDSHQRFYLDLELTFRAGGYFFVHAGVQPGIELDRQSERTLLWIRDEFLNWPGDFGAVVVHGHTPKRWPDDRQNRIGIDTHAFSTGTLTAVGLEGERRWFLST
jgi:serine/threonine protein phosphatase 1